MSRRSNFIDGNDNFREKNLRFVRNEFEENINQFFGGAGGGAGPEQTGNGPPPRDSIIVHPTPGSGNGEQQTFRTVELDQRLQFLHQLGVKRSQAHALAVASLKVPDFNLRDFQRQRFRMSVEAGDSRQSEVDAFIMREIHAMIGSHQERPRERPSTPPPPCNIDWNGSRERSPLSFRHISRHRDPSPEHFGLVHRFDEQERNKHFRERNSNLEREDNFHEREHNISRARQPQYFERNDNLRDAKTFNDTNPQFMGTSRNKIIENLCLNQRNERVRDEDRGIYKNNREPNNFNPSYNRHRKSPKQYLTNPRNNNIREEPTPRSLERNFEINNTNDFNEDFRAVPRHMQEQNYCEANAERRRFNDERDEPRFYNGRKVNYREDNFCEQQSDFRGRGQDLDERFHQQDDGEHRGFNFDSDNFGPQPGDNFNDRNRTVFNRNRYNPDYNALLDTDGRLLDERRNADHDFSDRTNRNFNDFQSSQLCNDRNQTNWNNIDIAGGQANWNNIDNSRNQLNWNNDDNPRSFNYPGEYMEMMQPNNNGSFPNRNSQQSMHQSRNNFPNRAQQQPPKRNNATKRPLVNTPPGQRQMANQTNKNHPNANRPTTSQAGKQNQQQPPPNRAGNIVAKKPLLPAPTGSRNGKNQQKINTNTGPNANRPQHPPTNRVVNPAAAAKFGQKRVADATNSSQATKVEIKKRKISEKRGFLIGGHKLPYINRSGKVLPQPEDKSYAVTFFEQKPIYNTSIFARDNDEGDMVNMDDDDGEGENTDDDEGVKHVKMGNRKRSTIRKRIDKAWTKIYRLNNYKCWLTWWKAYKWCEPEMNKQLEKFGSLNIKQWFLPNYPKRSTAQVINMVMKSAHFALEENTRSHFRNAKTLYVLMNETFLENLPLRIIEQLQDMIRGIPNHLWVYRMRTMVYLWAEYYKVIKAQPRAEAAFVAIQTMWKKPALHWMCKQAYDELKAISAIEWADHDKEYPRLSSARNFCFCVKSFKLNSNEKFFINVGQAPEVPGPKDLTEEELIAILESSTPGSFRVPMSISEVRNTKDRSNNTVEVCDIAINPNFLLKIKKSQLFYNFFLQIVAEALSEKYNIQITMSKTIVLTNRKFIGTLVSHRVRNDDIQRADAAGVAPGGGVDKSIEGLQAKQSTSKPASLVQEIDEESAASIRNTWAKNREPLYKLRARVRGEIVDELHAELYLPNCVSSHEFNLDIGEDRILVESLKHGYIFDKFVSYRLNQERAQALFDKTSKMLQVRIPVLSP